jgi:hypothetical protein
MGYGFFLLLWIAVLARWVLSGWSARGDRQLEAQHTAELARLREEVDQLTAQVLRLQDEQAFTMRLLGEPGARPGTELEPGAPETPTTTEKP